MRIVQLKVADCQRIQVAEVNPDPTGLVVVGGRNAQGKTSLLDAIWWAFGGKSALPDEPVREGADRGEVTITLDNGFVINRIIEHDRTTKLVVESKDGLRPTKPQDFLDKLTQKVAFDPLAFLTLDGKKQVEVLRGIVGLDFTDLEADRLKAYDERTSVNRYLERLEGRAATMVFHRDAPEAEVSVTDLVATLQEVNDGIHRRRTLENEADTLRGNIAQAENRLGDIDTQIAQLTQRRAEIEQSRTQRTEELEAAVELLAGWSEPDPAPIQAKIATAEEVNAKVRANAERRTLVAEVDRQKKVAEDLTATIQAKETEKRRLLSEAKFPVPGLSFDEEQPRLDDRPFKQGSAAERLRASVAIGNALNPELQVMLVREGHRLDDDGLRLLWDLAQERGSQVWIERVGTGEEVQVVIEDGMVAETREVSPMFKADRPAAPQPVPAKGKTAQGGLDL